MNRAEAGHQNYDHSNQITASAPIYAFTVKLPGCFVEFHFLALVFSNLEKLSVAEAIGQIANINL